MRHASVWNRWFVSAPILAGALWAAPGRAQLATPPATIEDALKGIASQAAVIFTGSVTRISALQNGDALIAFSVEEGLRGAASGSSYTLRLSSWAGGAERFHAGQRALFLLHAPSAAGYSSPVGGDLGVVPLAGDMREGSVDLRWLAATVLRDAPVHTPSAPEVTLRAASVASPAVARVSVSDVQQRQSNVTGQDVHAIDRDLVTGMLRTWDAADKRMHAGSANEAQGAGGAR